MLDSLLPICGLLSTFAASSVPLTMPHTLDGEGTMSKKFRCSIDCRSGNEEHDGDNVPQAKRGWLRSTEQRPHEVYYGSSHLFHFNFEPWWQVAAPKE